MAYIFDMASGTEYLGDEAQSAENAVPTLLPGSDSLIELQLAEPTASMTPEKSLPAGFDIQSVIDKLVD